MSFKAFANIRIFNYEFSITALLNNTQTMKFKTQPTALFFTAANIIVDVSETNDALRKMIRGSSLYTL